MYFYFLLLPLPPYPNGLIHSQLRSKFTFPSLSCLRYFILIPKQLSWPNSSLPPWFSNHSSKEQGHNAVFQALSFPLCDPQLDTEDGISLGWNLTELQRKKHQCSLCVPWYGGRTQNAHGCLRPRPTLLDSRRSAQHITRYLHFSSSLTMLILSSNYFAFFATE